MSFGGLLIWCNEPSHSYCYEPCPGALEQGFSLGLLSLWIDPVRFGSAALFH